MNQPALIAIGGFPGCGKSTQARLLSAEFGIPCLSSDLIGKTIKQSEGRKNQGIDAYWIAYDVLFAQCRAFLSAGVSVIIDTTMGWAFQWEQFDALAAEFPDALPIPIVLRCPLDVCLARIQARYDADPDSHEPPDFFTSDSRMHIWHYLNDLKNERM